MTVQLPYDSYAYSFLLGAFLLLLKLFLFKPFFSLRFVA